MKIKKENKIIHNGINLNKIKSSKKYDVEKNLVLYVGRLEKYKNVQHAIKTTKYLPDDFLFYIIGKGSYSPQLKRMIRKMNLEERVKMLGELSDEEVYRWMKTASAFVNFSGIEAFGMTCIEALAAGTPVVVNNDKMGLTETAKMFKDEISMVDISKQTPKEVAKTIIRASQNEVCPNLKKFDWSSVTQEFREVYEKLITR